MLLSPARVPARDGAGVAGIAARLAILGGGGAALQVASHGMVPTLQTLPHVCLMSDFTPKADWLPNVRFVPEADI